MRDATLKGQKTTFFRPVSKVPRLCPLLPLEVTLRKGTVVGSEKVKFLDVDPVVGIGEKLIRGFSAYDRN